MDQVLIADDARAANRRMLRRLGFGRVPDDVGPPPPGPIRAKADVLDRALALQVVVAVAGGLDAASARRWLDGLGVAASLQDDEAEYLDDAADGIRVEDVARATAVEALAVLLWALGLLPSLPVDEPTRAAAGVLAAPGEPVDDVLEAARLRPVEALVAAHDLAAGMAWALRDDPDLEVGAALGSLDPYVVRQRHQAFRWLLGAPWVTA